MRGVRQLPPPESDSNSETVTFAQFVTGLGAGPPSSFAELRAKLKADAYNSAAGSDSGDPKAPVRLFEADVRRVVANALRWHAGGRWVPDTIKKLDPNNCTVAEIEAAGTAEHKTSRRGGAAKCRGCTRWRGGLQSPPPGGSNPPCA